jgi:hypothetical protein
MQPIPWTKQLTGSSVDVGSLWLYLATFYLSIRKISISYQNLYIFLAKPQPIGKTFLFLGKKLYLFLTNFIYIFGQTFIFWQNL